MGHFTDKLQQWNSNVFWSIHARKKRSAIMLDSCGFRAKWQLHFIMVSLSLIASFGGSNFRWFKKSRARFIRVTETLLSFILVRLSVEIEML